MKWTQARHSVSGDYPVTEIEDENGVTVADAYEHAGLIEAAPDMLKLLEDILYAHDMKDNGASNNTAKLNNQLECRARDLITLIGGFTSAR